MPFLSFKAATKFSMLPQLSVRVFFRSLDAILMPVVGGYQEFISIIPAFNFHCPDQNHW